MFDVIGIGRSCIDYLAVVESLPPPDSKIPVLEYRREEGGQSSTAMVALSRLGLQVAYAGVVGDDPEGRLLIEGLEKEGVDTSNVRVVEGKRTPVALILVEAGKGTRTIAYLDSPEGELSGSGVERAKLLDAKCLMIDPYGTKVGVEIAGEAKEKGATVIYDAEHPVEGFYEMVAASDYVVGSEAVIKTIGSKTPEEALEKLLSFGPETAVITLGSEGCIALTADGLNRKPAFPVEVVDTTAAGDTFHAGFAYGLLQGWELDKILDFASALGALVCRGLGGRQTLPSLDETLQFLKWLG